MITNVLLVLFFTIVILISLFNQKFLIYFLNKFFTVSFWLALLFLLYLLTFEVFTEKGNLETSNNSSITSQNHHSIGYSVPVHLNLYFSKPYKQYKSRKSHITKDSLGNTI